MLYDFIISDKNAKTPMYRQIYLSIRQAIENGTLKKGSRLPSVRGLSAEKNISKTTVISAYEQLCAEGYITNKPQSGYYVAAQFENRPIMADALYKPEIENRFFEYDFSGKSIDEKIVDLAEWKKCLKDVVNRNYLLTSYGDVQGEEALREALQKYALGTRSVNARTDNIIVGAGTQAILYLLCSLIGFGKTIAVEKGGFVQSEFIFRSFDYRVKYYECDEYGVTVNSLRELNPDLILINPNFSGKRGDTMPVTRRLELIEWAKKNGALLIEDDYNGELRYSTLPTPCVQHYDADNTVYIGSFSKVLLPSVRVGYMVLTPELLKRYAEVRKLMNQTASKTEQLALARYISSRKIDAHLRKARRVYLEKSKSILESIEKHLPEASVRFNETSLYLTVSLPFDVNSEALENALRENSVRLRTDIRGEGAFALSFSGISEEKIDDGIRIISETIKEII